MMAQRIGGLDQSGRNMVDDLASYQTRHSVSYTLEYPVSQPELWQLISRGGNLNECHPFCLENEVIDWQKDAHSDRLVYLNGMTYIRQFIHWEEGNGYALIIGTEGGPQSYVVWQLTEISPRSTKLSITVYPYLLAKLPKAISFLPYLLYIRPKLRTYLKSVLNGFSYYNATGKAVPRNHWGRHTWFS